jgi:hypothetical protein
MARTRYGARSPPRLLSTRLIGCLTLFAMCGVPMSLVVVCTGVQQSMGWVHYEVHTPEPHILLFRRPLGTDPTTGKVLGNVTNSVNNQSQAQAQPMAVSGAAAAAAQPSLAAAGFGNDQKMKENKQKSKK